MRVFHAIIVFSLIAAPLEAQVTTAGIFGTVNDRSGAVVPGADVTVVNTETNFTRSTKSGTAGEYTLTALPLGPYKIEAALPGFKKFEQTGIVLDVARNARVDVVLELGTMTEVMSVTADAPLVNTSNAQVGRTVTSLEIIQMPLVNRDLYSLLNLTPGVEMNATANTVGFRQTSVAINGSGDGGTGSVAYYLDGHQDPPGFGRGPGQGHRRRRNRLGADPAGGRLGDLQALPGHGRGPETAGGPGIGLRRRTL